MITMNEALHVGVRNSRRLAGRAKLAAASVDGTAPTAVVAAVKKAAFGRPSPEERRWIERIELLRRLLETSPEELTLTDLGAGAGAKFDSGEAQTAHVVVKTLGAMTRSSSPPRWAYLLFRLVRELRPASVLELGSCVGVSASYQAAALELNGQAGRLISLEGADVLALRSQRTLEELGLRDRAEVRPGRFVETLGGAADDLAPIDLAFIDGHHVETATLEYAETILERASDEATLIFDDIHWSDGMRSAWSRIEADDRYALTLDLRKLGIAVVSKTAGSRANLRAGYY